MRVRSRNGKLPGVRTRFNARSFVLIAMSILLCVGITGCGGGSVTAPGAFALSSPANGSTIFSLTPTLNWTDATGENSYTVEVDDENTFSPPLVHEDTGIAAGTTGFVVPDGVLAGGTTYYWRVIAANSAGSTIASNAPFSFTPLSSGSLVPGFGAGGVVTDNPSTGSDQAEGIAIDSTAMYVVGCDDSPGNVQWRIEKRSLTDGSLVSDFGTGGVVIINPSPGVDIAYGIAIDSNAMYVVGSDESPGNRQWRIEKRSLTDGSLFPAFGTGGVVTGNHSMGYDGATGIAIDSNAMYVVGYDESPGNRQWRIEKRSLTDGSLFPAFGTGGVVTSNNSSGDDTVADIAIDSNAMYMIGHDRSPGNQEWRVEKRSLTDGSLIAEFGTNGVVIGDHSMDHDAASGIAIDSTAIYVVGYDHSPGNQEWRIEKRSLTNGSLVTGFGTGGVVTSNPSTSFDGATDIAIDSTAMYVVGRDDNPGNRQWRIEKRSLADGSLIGVFTSNPSTGDDYVYGIAIDSTAMYVVGYDYSPGDWEWRIEKRSLTDGSLVPGFGPGGVVIGDHSMDHDAASGIAIDSNAMYVVGYDYGPGNNQWRIEKRSLTDGSLVPGFGTGGVVTSNPSPGDDRAYGIAIDSTAMYVVGSDYSPGNCQWRIEKRSLADGGLVGVFTSNPSLVTVPQGIVIDSTAMYVVGYDFSPGDYQWRMEKRSLADGGLVSGFGTGGVVTSDPSTGSDQAEGIAVDSTAMYVVGYDYSPGNHQWRIEKRSLTDGSLVLGFGTGGVVTGNPSTDPDSAKHIAIDATAMYVVGYDYSPGNYQWRIEKRSLTDGSLVPSFGTGGVVTSNPSTSAEMAYDIAIDSTAMYVVGLDGSPGNNQWRIEKRNLTDGSLVPGFGTGGVVTSNPSTSSDVTQDIAIDSNVMYIVGFDYSPGNQEWRIEKRVK